MQAIKGISRVGWLVTGIIVALVLAPTAALAAGAVSSGSSSNATATVATPPAPKAYETYVAGVSADTTEGGVDCTTAQPQGPAVPANDAFVLQQVEVDTYGVSLNNTRSDVAYSDNGFNIDADTPAQGCGNGNTITTGDTSTESNDAYPNLGNETVPITPGYVVPSGTNLDVYAAGIDATFTFSGYLIPASKASPLKSTPDKSLVRRGPKA
jgi:hypothetical protein